MAERALRGARLGTQSFEDERGVEMAPRQQIEYVLADGTRFEITMSVEAEVPEQWDDPRTGQTGRRADVVDNAPDEDKGARTHWDMLLERRSQEELEDILSERLELLRSGEVGPVHLQRKKPQTKKAAGKKA